jgi:hypothetical protein
MFLKEALKQGGNMKRVIIAVLVLLPLVLLFPQEPSGASETHVPPPENK